MLSLVLLLAAASATPQSALVSVYVSAPIRDGFVDTDKETQDSIKDFRGKLSGMKEFRIVETREAADLVITIVTRGVGSETYGQRLNYSEYSGRYYKNAQLTNTPIVAQTLWVSAVMEIGGYRKELWAPRGTYQECVGAGGPNAPLISQRISRRGLSPTGSR